MRLVRGFRSDVGAVRCLVGVNARNVVRTVVVALAVVVGLAGVAPAAPQHMIDEEQVIAAATFHARTIKIAVAAPVQLVVQGLRYADKGFMVYVMSPEDFAHFQRREPFHYFEALYGLKIRSFTQTATLPAGDWVFVVHNSENLIRSMVVRVRIVVDPETRS